VATDGERGAAAGSVPAAVSAAQEIIAYRVEEVRADAQLLEDAIRTLVRVPVTNGEIVRYAKADVEGSLKALLDSVARLVGSFA
jgi:hypothetical protein